MKFTTGNLLVVPILVSVIHTLIIAMWSDSSAKNSCRSLQHRCRIHRILCMSDLYYSKLLHKAELYHPFVLNSSLPLLSLTLFHFFPLCNWSRHWLAQPDTIVSPSGCNMRPAVDLCGGPQCGAAPRATLLALILLHTQSCLVCS